MTRDAMRRLRATNPVPELPPLTPITAVMPGWEGTNRPDDASLAENLAARRSPRRWTRAGSLLIPALSGAVALIVAGIALTTIRPDHRSAAGAPASSPVRASSIPIARREPCLRLSAARRDRRRPSRLLDHPSVGV
jgi:hypothetical protein